MVSKSGYSLLRPEAEQAIKELISIADVVTPNIPEAELLTGMRLNCQPEITKAAEKILEAGARAVLIKGGHLEGGANDLLLTADICLLLETPRIPTKNTHGTGCTLSSAIACGMADGLPIEQAVRRAKEYVTQAIRDSLDIGAGAGPLGHMAELYRRAI
jgi:hydroxymethylpyrimidine/phosphomethylpyrimidine kinase